MRKSGFSLLWSFISITLVNVEHTKKKGGREEEFTCSIPTDVQKEGRG